MSTTAPRTLAEVINLVMSEEDYVQRSRQMEAGNNSYTYAGEADFIAAFRPWMTLHGLVCLPIKHDMTLVEHGPTRSGVMQFRCTTIVTWEIRATDCQERMHIQTIGQGVDTGDKAAYKAQTGALKYALRQMFIVQTGDDPDAQSSIEQETTGKKDKGGKQKKEDKPQSRLPPREKVMDDLETSLNQRGFTMENFKRILSEPLEKTSVERLIQFVVRVRKGLADEKIRAANAGEG